MQHRESLSWEQLEPSKFECSGLPEDICMAGHSMLSFCKGSTQSAARRKGAKPRSPATAKTRNRYPIASNKGRARLMRTCGERITMTLGSGEQELALRIVYTCRPRISSENRRALSRAAADQCTMMHDSVERTLTPARAASHALR